MSTHTHIANQQAWQSTVTLLGLFIPFTGITGKSQSWIDYISFNIGTKPSIQQLWQNQEETQAPSPSAHVCRVHWQNRDSAHVTKCTRVLCVLCAQSPLTLRFVGCSPRGSSLCRFPRQEHWSALPFPTPRDLPNSGTELTSLVSPALPGRSFITGPPGKSLYV